VKEPRNFTVAEYRTMVKKTMEDIWQRKALPVLVGGSMFYLRALLFPPEQSADDGRPEQSPEDVRMVLSAEEKLKLWHDLYEIDPERAQKIDKHDGYRIQRALKIWHDSGVKPSLYQPKYQPLANFHITFITRERDDLYQRIDTRVIEMFDQGWIAEVASLSDQWHSFLAHKKLLGYPEIIHMLEQKSRTSEERAQVCALIQKKTRNYAKRQITFWRSLKEALNERVGTPARCEELNLTLSSVDLYLNHIQHIVDAEVKDYHE
jgi:tRNA dimethylallyltransferase